MDQVAAAPLAAAAAPLAAAAASPLAAAAAAPLATDMSKAKWNHFNQVLHILIFAGGQLFGGCPRDIVYRLHHYKAYMKFCKEHDIDGYFNYNDLSVHPESAEGRNLVPADIDCFFRNQGMREEALESLKFFGVVHRRKHPGYLINKHPELKEYMEQDSYKIKFSLPKATKWFLRTVMGDEFVKKMMNQTIKIDMLTYVGPPLRFLGAKQMFSPPFGLERDVNVNQLSLIYNHLSGGKDIKIVITTSASDQPFMTLEKIHEAILTKKAVACTTMCDSHRIKKMVKKGYTIQFKPPFGQMVPAAEDDKCVLCLATIDTDDHGPYQPCVCPAKYHLACFAECFLSLSEGKRVKCQYCRAHLQCYGHYCDFWKQIGLYRSARQRYLGQLVAAPVHNNCMRCGGDAP